MTMATETANLIEALRTRGMPKRWVERKLAVAALGVVAAIEEGSMSPAEGGEELFNVANYRAIKHRRLDAKVREIFEWGMELEDVAELAPESLPLSYAAIRELASGLLRLRPPVRRGGAGSRRAAGGRAAA